MESWWFSFRGNPYFFSWPRPPNYWGFENTLT